MNILDRILARVAGVHPEALDLAREYAPTDTVERANLPLAASSGDYRGAGGARSTASVAEWLANLGTDRGRQINLKDVYSDLVPVYAGIRLRAGAVAKAPLKFYETDPNDEEKEDWVGAQHPVQRLFDWQNPHWTRARMWQAVETQLCIWGSAFRWINRVDPNDVSKWEIWSIRPDRVQVVRDRYKYIAGFIHDPQGSKFPMLPEEIIWDHYYNPDNEFGGLSPLRACLGSVAMYKQMLETNRKIFENGLLPSNLAFFIDGPITNDQYELLQARFAERFGGVRNAGKPIIIDQGRGNIQNIGHSNSELQFLEGLNFSRDQMMMALQVPEELFPGGRNVTYANREEAARQFYNEIIAEEWDMLSSEINEQFIPSLPPMFHNLKARFDRNSVDILAGNLAVESGRLINLISTGLMTINQACVRLGLDTQPWGDVWWMGGTPITGPENPHEAAAKAANEKDKDEEPPPGIEGLTGTHPTGPSGPTGNPGADNSTLTVTDTGDMTPGNAGGSQFEFSYSEDALYDVWRSYCRQLDEDSLEFLHLQRQLFQEQREYVLEQIRRRWTPRRDVNPNAIFESESWIHRFLNRGRPFMQRSLFNGGQSHTSLFNLGPNFNVFRPTAQVWIDSRTHWWARVVNRYTAEQLIRTVAQSNEEGEPLRRLEDRIVGMFEGMTETRAERIARTETTAALNRGHLEAYAEAGVGHKRWLATRDPRVREPHLLADGQVVPLEKPFLVGGELLEAPGQGNDASPGNVVNCRCTTLPVFDDDDDEEEQEG